MASRSITRALSLVAAAAAGAALTLNLSGGGVAQSAHRPTPDRHGTTTAQVRTVAHYTARLATPPVKNTIYVYKIPTITSAPFVVKFPKLPKAPYFVTYSLTGGASDSTSRFICWLDHGAGTHQEAFTYSAEWNHFLTNNGSGTIDSRAGAYKLHCNATGTATTMPATTSPSAATVSFMRADALVKKSATVTP